MNQRTIVISALFSCLLMAVGCTTTSDYFLLDYEFFDFPEESRIELVYRNDNDFSVCLRPEAWPDSKGLINGAPQIVVLVIGNRGFPVTAPGGFMGQCVPVDACLKHVAPGEVLSVSIPYSSFTFPEDLHDEPKSLDFTTAGQKCPRNARK